MLLFGAYYPQSATIYTVALFLFRTNFDNYKVCHFDFVHAMPYTLYIIFLDPF